MRTVIVAGLGALMGMTALVATPGAVAGLSCARDPEYVEIAIHSGWPEAAPFEHVVIATIRDIKPVNGDAGTWGEILTVKVDAVLRGDLPLSTTEIFNPPLGMPGWPWFEAGGQFLIAASPEASWSHGRVATSLCAPNEEITSPERFQELVSFSAAPVLSDTAMTPPSPLPPVGLTLLLLAVAVVARRSMRADDRVH